MVHAQGPALRTRSVTFDGGVLRPLVLVQLRRIRGAQGAQSAAGPPSAGVEAAKQ